MQRARRMSNGNGTIGNGHEKAVEKEMRRLEVELVKFQEWIKPCRNLRQW
jgi:hypothetical protein